MVFLGLADEHGPPTIPSGKRSDFHVNPIIAWMGQTSHIEARDLTSFVSGWAEGLTRCERSSFRFAMSVCLD